VEKVRNANLTRRVLDKRFKFAKIDPIRAVPEEGWICAIRTALGMSQKQVADRLGMSRGAVESFERREISGGISIASLAQVAEALDCQLLYALVPNTTLEETLMRPARSEIAKTFVGKYSGDLADKAEYIEHFARLRVIRGQAWK
jgi:predicted DNA-binding mobile mystery protein A